MVGRDALIAPTAIEVAVGRVLGRQPSAVPLPAPGQVEPLAALEAAVAPFLRRTPCIVAFSGGRDSSVILAAAARLAAREGLAAPVPLTLRFPYATTKEDEWQELVIDHLGLPDWERVHLTEELDIVGGFAARGLRAHGVMFPPNAHLVGLIAQHARGGSVLTGDGGDAVLGTWQWHTLASTMALRTPPRPADLRMLVHASMPVRLRAEVLRRRQTLLMPWLREGTRQRMAGLLARELAREPRSWSGRTRAIASERLWRASQSSAATLGHDVDVAVGAPLLAPTFLASLAQAGGRLGWGSRTATMRALFSGLLPESIVARPTKAVFGPTFMGSASHAFAQRWDGRAGVDLELIDPDVLRAVWLSETPHFGSAMLMQSAWLASEVLD